MGSGGHNKKPTALRILEGNPGKRPLPENEPKPRPLMPKCPSWLPKEAKKKWKELAPMLQRVGLLTEADGEVLAAMCLHWSLMVEAAKDIAKRGQLVLSAREDSALVKNVSVAILRDNSESFKKYASLFGLNPADRSKLAIPVIEEYDEMQDLLSGLQKRD